MDFETLDLPFAYMLTYKVPLGRTEWTNMVRDHAFFEVRSVGADDAPIGTRFVGRETRAYDGECYQETCILSPIDEATLRERLARDATVPMNDHEWTRAGLPRITGPGMADWTTTYVDRPYPNLTFPASPLSFMDEAALVRKVTKDARRGAFTRVGDDRPDRLARAAATYARSLLIVDGRLYAKALEPRYVVSAEANRVSISPGFTARYGARRSYDFRADHHAQATAFGERLAASMERQFVDMGGRIDFDDASLLTYDEGGSIASAVIGFVPDYLVASMDPNLRAALYETDVDDRDAAWAASVMSNPSFLEVVDCLAEPNRSEATSLHDLWVSLKADHETAEIAEDEGTLALGM